MSAGQLNNKTMKNKQTAVEWLFLKMNRIRLDYEMGNLTSLDFIENQKKIYNEAKEMEKSQIKDAYDFAMLNDINIYSRLYPEDYYNETYNKK